MITKHGKKNWKQLAPHQNEQNLFYCFESKHFKKYFYLYIFYLLYILYWAFYLSHVYLSNVVPQHNTAQVTVHDLHTGNFVLETFFPCWSVSHYHKESSWITKLFKCMVCTTVLCVSLLDWQCTLGNNLIEFQCPTKYVTWINFIMLLMLFDQWQPWHISCISAIKRSKVKIFTCTNITNDSTSFYDLHIIHIRFNPHWQRMLPRCLGSHKFSKFTKYSKTLFGCQPNTKLT